MFPLYDQILVFGDAGIRTTAQDLDLDSDYPGLVEHTGYLGRQIHLDPPRTKRDPPLLIATAGGGHDAATVIEPLIEYLQQMERPHVRIRIIPGPFLSRSKVRALRKACAGKPSVEIVASTNRMERHMAEAGASVSMLGYNTAVELICAGIPALVIPRSSPSGEQVLRASRLAGPAGLKWCESGPRALEFIAELIEEALAGATERPQPNLDLGGIPRSVKLLESML